MQPTTELLPISDNARIELLQMAHQSGLKITAALREELESIERRQATMEKQLIQNGIAVSDEIPYETAKSRIDEIQSVMVETMQDDQAMRKNKFAYYAMEEELAKDSTALMMTDEWEASNEDDNKAALRSVRRHIPVNVRNMSEDALLTEATPNGKVLPKAYAKKLKRVHVLQLLQVNPLAVERMHPLLLEGLRTMGLTLTERKALHQHLKFFAEVWESMKVDKNQEKRHLWFQNLKLKFQEMLCKYKQHVQDHGPPESHGKCGMIDNQCPVKADLVVGYSQDNGHPTDAQYEPMAEMHTASPTAGKLRGFLSSNRLAHSKNQNQ